jgi:hypothetical protein
MPFAHPIMAVVDGPADSRKSRMELDVRMAACDEGFYVTGIERIGEGTRDLDDLFRQLRLPRSSASWHCPASIAGQPSLCESWLLTCSIQ